MPATSFPPTEAKRTELLRVLVSPSEMEELRQRSEERGVPVAALVRRALLESREDEAA